MSKINMSELKRDFNLSSIDTYGQIEESEIEEMEAAGFDLWQEYANNTHMGFYWGKRGQN